MQQRQCHFDVNGNEHTIHFLKKQPQVHSINSIEKNSTITIGGFEFPLPTIKKKYDILMVGDMHIPFEVTVGVKTGGSRVGGPELCV